MNTHKKLFQEFWIDDIKIKEIFNLLNSQQYKAAFQEIYLEELVDGEIRMENILALEENN